LSAAEKLFKRYSLFRPAFCWLLIMPDAVSSPRSDESAMSLDEEAPSSCFGFGFGLLFAFALVDKGLMYMPLLVFAGLIPSTSACTCSVTPALQQRVFFMHKSAWLKRCLHQNLMWSQPRRTGDSPEKKVDVD
jgi:hypothetical protein